MCGRYAILSEAQQLASRFKAASVAAYAPNADARPTQKLPVIRANPQSGQYQADLLNWGLVPRFAESIKDAAKLINARSETAFEKPSFRQAWAKRRCLIPANHFYEWVGKGKYKIGLHEDVVFAMAGLWEGWQNPQTGDWHKTFTILTTNANTLVFPLHGRMPVIISPEFWQFWLTSNDNQQLRAIMQPYPPELMTVGPAP